MRVQPGLGLVAACVVIAAAGTAAARPTVAIAGIEVSGDSVGVDVEAAGIARELSWALRRAVDRDDSPLQLVDPMVRADDVEALLWGKLIRDGDTWVVTVHLSAVGSDGDTVSYRAILPQTKTSSVELGRWGKIIYDSLLDQIDIDDKDDKVPAPAPSAAGLVDPFAVREAAPFGDPPIEIRKWPPPTLAPLPAEEPATDFRTGRRPWLEPAPNASARRLFWISSGVAGAGALFWLYSYFRVSDAEDQIERLAGCTGCDAAINAANAQGNRWEGISWLAGTATVAGTAAALLFGYQAFIAGRKPAPSELVGRRGSQPRAVTFVPVIDRAGVGAGMMVVF